MLRRLKFIVPMALALALLAGNVNMYVAHAHNWGSYHWNKTGPYIYIYQQWAGGSYYTQAELARQNAWNAIGQLYNYWVGYHTDVTVWDAYYGATGWGGLASLESVEWDAACNCYDHITHGHARVNTYYEGWWDLITTQGVFCQEVFHTYGFTHDNYGDCMGIGYYAGSVIWLNGHNNDDFYNRYRYH